MMHHFPTVSFRRRGAGFSLIEVVIAIGIFGVSILAIVALLGSISRSTTDVMDAGVSARLADSVRAELQALPVSGGGASLANLIPVNPNTPDPLILFANRDASRVLRGNGANPPVDNHHETGDPPGILERDRYYRIEVRRLGENLTYDPSDDGGFIALSVKVYWPDRVRTGPGPTDHRPVEPHRQSLSMFNVAIVRNQ